MVTDCSHSERSREDGRGYGWLQQGHHHVRGHRVRPHATCRRTCPTRSRTSSTSRVAAVEAGRAVIHLHARDPKDGSPTADPAASSWSTSRHQGRRPTPSSASPAAAAPAMTVGSGCGCSTRPSPSCAPSTWARQLRQLPDDPEVRRPVKFRLGRALPREHPAEPFVSTFADIEHMLKVVGPETGARFETEAYDAWHLYTLAYYLEPGLVQPPIFLQTILGAMGGIGPRSTTSPHEATTDKLFGDAYSGPRRCRAGINWHDHRRRRHGLARAGRARGRPVHRQGPAGCVERRPGRKITRILAGSRWRSRHRPRRRGDSGSRASTRSAGDARAGRPEDVAAGRTASPSRSSATGVIGAGWARTSCGWG